MKGLLMFILFGLMFTAMLTVGVLLLCKTGLMGKAEKFMDEYEKSKWKSS